MCVNFLTRVNEAAENASMENASPDLQG